MENKKNKFQIIYSCFSRSLDNYHVSNQKIHLISSIMGYVDNMEVLEKYVEINKNSRSEKISYIFVVVEGLVKNITLEDFIKDNVDDVKTRVEHIHEKIVVIIININSLLGHLNYTKMDNELFENIFGRKNMSNKDYENIYQNSLFVFCNISWSNVVLYFRKNGVHISSGSSSRRHILNSVDMQLMDFINEIYPYGMDKTILYDMWKSPFLCKTIPENLDLKLIDKNNENAKYLTLNKYLVQNNIINEFKDDAIDNLFISLYLLITSIIKKYESIISKNKESMSNLESNCSSLSYRIEENRKYINNDRPSGMSSKEKRKFKEERNMLLKDRSNNMKVSSMKNQIIKNTNNIEILKNQIIKNEMELENFRKNYKNISISELNKLYESLATSDNKCYRFSKTKDNKKSNSFNMFIRSYSTTRYNINDNNMLNTNELVDNSLELNSKILCENNKLSKNNIINIISDKENNSNINIFLGYFDEIIQDSKLNPLEMQKTIENKWVDHMLLKLDTIDNKARNSLSYIIKKSAETLSLILESKKIRKRFLGFYSKLNKNHLIIAYSIMTTFYDKLGFTSIAMKIANDILYDIYSKEWIKYINSESYVTFNKYILNKGINDVVKLKLGSFFIEIFCRKPTEIFDRSYKFDKLNGEVNDSDLAILEVNDEFFNFINNNFILSPVSLPMLCLPNKWSETKFGGYLNNYYTKEEIITGSPNQKHIMENKQPLYNAINKLNSIKFKINTNLLNYLENEGFYILEHYFNNQLKDKTDRNQSRISLMIAKSLSKFNYPFYICTSADWRGRIYTNSFFISYQGGDLSNALLNLFDGMELTDSGLNYLYIYGANCYNVNNLSKKSFKDRIEWVKENYNNIINLDKEFILKANNLLLFTSFCLIMKEIHKNPKYKVHMPIFLDATCSGIQHLSALIQDLESAMKVNLIPQNINDKVGDIYSDLINPINNAINLFGENNLEYFEFKKIKLNRKHLKLPIMTKIYNVSVIGIADQLRSSFDKTVNKNKFIYFSVPTEDGFIKLSNREIYILAEIINKQIFSSLPSLEGIYNYFKNIVKLCLICNIPLTWFTPSGLKITQYYAVSNQNKVSISFKNKTKSVILREVTNKLDTRKQVNSIIPNIVHSLDASHLINIINTGLQNVDYPDILTVHDCFGSHPNNIDILKTLVISEFVKLYSNENFLKKLNQRIIQSLNDNNFEIFKDTDGKEYLKPKRTKIYLPSLPQPGKLDYSKILLSQYLIN